VKYQKTDGENDTKTQTAGAVQIVADQKGSEKRKTKEKKSVMWSRTLYSEGYAEGIMAQKNSRGERDSQGGDFGERWKSKEIFRGEKKKGGLQREGQQAKRKLVEGTLAKSRREER